MSKKPKNPKPSQKSSSESQKRNPGPLPGEPGYRTRDGRSGFDPLDTSTESGHVLGVWVQHFLTGQIKTKNPVHLLLMAVLGLALVLPLAFAIAETVRGNPMPWNTWIILIVTSVIGLLTLTNFIKNLVRIRK